MEIKTISPTQIIKFINEYNKWYDQYILGIKEPDNIYFQAGTACHNFIEALFTEKPKDGETISTFATRRFAELFNTFVTENKEMQEFFNDEINAEVLKDWLTEYVRIWVKETQKLEKKYGTQNAFKYNTPLIMEEEIINEKNKIKCRIDAVYTTDKFNPTSKTLTSTIIDFKTSSKTRSTIPLEYYIQLQIYALVYPKKVYWVGVDYIKYQERYYFIVNNQTRNNTQQLIDEVWYHILEIVKLVNEGKYEEAKQYNHGLKLENFV